MRFFRPNVHLPNPVRGGFTIFELVMVAAIAAVLMALVMPAFQGMGAAGNITNAAYDVAGVLENARAYATSNNTYVWVGFFEEDGSKASTFPATAGTGRLVMSTVASRDGTAVHDTRDNPPSATMDPTRLLQIGKLVKTNNAHFAILPNGDGTGAMLDTRPVVDAANGKYGEINAPGSASRPTTDSKFPFVYPVGPGTTIAAAQYTFRKTLQFNPRGESIVNSTYSLRAVVEIGLQPARGNIINTANRNVAAVQIAGIAGNVKIYRR